MVKIKRSAEEINKLLFDDEVVAVNDQSQNLAIQQQQNVVFQQQKTEPRLLKQRGLSTELEELEPVPYYKRPVVQTTVLLAIAVPMGWGLVSSFTGEGTTSQQASATVAEDKEKQLLQQSLEQERKKNTELEIKNGLQTQKMEVVPPTAKPALHPVPHPVHVSQPPPIVAMAPPVRTYTPPPLPPVQSVRLEPTPAPIQVIKAPTPAPAPKAPPPTFEEQKQKWLALGNVGNWGGDTALNDPSANPSLAASSTRSERSLSSSSISQAPASVVSQVRSPTSPRFADSPSSQQSQVYQPASYSPSSQQSQVYQPASYSPSSQVRSPTSPRFADSPSSQQSQVYQPASYSPSSQQSQVYQPASYSPSSQVRSPTSPRFADSPSIQQSQADQLASYSPSIQQSQAYPPANYSTSLQQTYPSANYSTSSGQPQAYQSPSYGSSAQVMVGSEAEAEIDRTLSWDNSNLTRGIQIPIRLMQPLKAIDNSDAIPAGSYLIAQVNGDSAGNLQLVVTSVLLSVNGKLQPEQPVSAVGSLLIISSKNGKPLRAQIVSVQGLREQAKN